MTVNMGDGVCVTSKLGTTYVMSVQSNKSLDKLTIHIPCAVITLGSEARKQLFTFRCN